MTSKIIMIQAIWKYAFRAVWSEPLTTCKLSASRMTGYYINIDIGSVASLADTYPHCSHISLLMARMDTFDTLFSICPQGDTLFDL